MCSRIKLYIKIAEYYSNYRIYLKMISYIKKNKDH